MFVINLTRRHPVVQELLRVWISMFKQVFDCGLAAPCCQTGSQGAEGWCSHPNRLRPLGRTRSLCNLLIPRRQCLSCYIFICPLAFHLLDQICGGHNYFSSLQAIASFGVIQSQEVIIKNLKT